LGKIANDGKIADGNVY